MRDCPPDCAGMVPHMCGHLAPCYSAETHTAAKDESSAPDVFRLDAHCQLDGMDAATVLDPMAPPFVPGRMSECSSNGLNVNAPPFYPSVRGYIEVPGDDIGEDSRSGVAISGDGSPMVFVHLQPTNLCPPLNPEAAIFRPADGAQPVLFNGSSPLPSQDILEFTPKTLLACSLDSTAATFVPTHSLGLDPGALCVLGEESHDVYSSVIL